MENNNQSPISQQTDLPPVVENPQAPITDVTDVKENPAVSPFTPVAPETPKQKSKLMPILLIVLILAVLGAGGLFAYKNFFVKTPEPTPTPETTPATTTDPIDETTINSKIYLLTVRLKSDTVLPPWQTDAETGIKNLAEYLSSVLGLQKDDISSLLYKTTSSPYSDPYNTSYYALFQNRQQLDKNYSDKYVSVATELVNEDLLPYLIKNEYCEKDSDCSIRSNMCAVGAYNYYQQFVDGPWGCGPAGYKDIYGFEYGMYDEIMKCDLDSLKFDGVKCVKNLCTEVGMQKVCMKQ